MSLEVGSAIFVNVDIYHSGRQVSRGGMMPSNQLIKKGDIGTVVDIVRDMSPGQWNEYAEVFFQKLRKKVPITIKELNDKINFSIME